MKRERWGSPLVQEKYREEKACDRRHTYRIVMIIIMIMIIIVIVIIGIIMIMIIVIITTTH